MTPLADVDRLSALLRAGTEREKLAALEDLSGAACECRALPGVHEPWREFQAVVGKQAFEALLELVRHAPPSEVRARAGDIMAQVLHPCAIGRLLEAFEARRETLAEDPPVRILKTLGGIGDEAAARALMWLWGSGCDDEVAGALGMCESSCAQDFLLDNAAAHGNSYVRAICMAHLKPPVTKEKQELFLLRLETGTQNEQFVAVMKVKEMRLRRAVPLLVSLRARDVDAVLRNEISEALAALS